MTELSTEISPTDQNAHPRDEGSFSSPQVDSNSLVENFFAKVGKPVQVAEAHPGPEVPNTQNEANNLARHLENITTNPSNYSPEEIDGFVSSALGNKDMSQIKTENPVLANSLEKLTKEKDSRLKKEIINLSKELEDPTLQEASDSSVIEEISINLQNIQEVERTSPDELILKTTDSNGQERRFSLSNAMALAAFVAVDLALFRGNNTLLLLHEFTQPLMDNKIRNVFGKMGMEITEDMYPRHHVYSDLLRYIKTPNLARFVEELPNNGNEMYKFLKGLGKEQYTRLLKGERFGGNFFDQHQFTHEQIEKVLSKLTTWQSRDLGIEQQNA